MDGSLVRVLGLFALLGIVAWGYRRWIGVREVGIQGKRMLLLTLVTLVGGLLGSTGWWIDDPRSFSWDLPPLAGRMLASAGWAFGVATFAALQKPVPRRMRLWCSCWRRTLRRCSSPFPCSTSTASILPRLSRTRSSRLCFL